MITSIAYLLTTIVPQESLTAWEQIKDAQTLTKISNDLAKHC